MGNTHANSVVTKFSDTWMKEVQAHSDEIKIPPQQPGWPYERREIRIIGDQGAQVFSMYFANNGVITDLSIEGPQAAKGETTFIGPEGFKVLADCLSRDPMLKKLKLTGHDISHEVAIFLALSLKENPNLTEISLWNNRITNETAYEIVEAFIHISTLQVLNLGENKITVDGKAKIEELLKKTGSKLQIQMF